jgi:tryptophan-rich hypothetical protein
MAHQDKRQGLSLGAKWTKLDPSDHEKHFEVIESGRDALLLRCIVTRNQSRVSRTILRASGCWRRGWH